MLQGAIALYEASEPDIASLLEKEPELSDTFDLLGCALHWLAREIWPERGCGLP